MIPRSIHVWDTAMPRTSSGKLARPDVIRSCKERISRQEALSGASV
jgi:hypothetical protein